MKTFIVRMVNTLTIVGVLIGYNAIVDAREKNEEIARLNAELETVRLEQQAAAADGADLDSADAAGNYADGVYEGTGQGFGGDITVSVTVSGGNISSVEIVSAEKEDGAYLTMAQDIIPAIIKAQSAEVDTVSGATFSSTGIRDAVEQALEKAVQHDKV